MTDVRKIFGEFGDESGDHRKFKQVPSTHVMNWNIPSGEPKPGTLGAHMSRKMEAKIREIVKDDDALVSEALHLSNITMKGVDTVEDLINVARARIAASS